jgi:membrane-associated protease RseP (regulator of RpoE activity)
MHARGEAPAPAAPVDPEEEPVFAHELAPTRRRAVFLLGGVSFNLLAAFAVEWLAFKPSAPWRAAARVARTTGAVLVDVPRLVVSLFLPGTYTSGRGGLVADAQPNVHGIGEAMVLFILVNVLVAAFNLFPVPPLDGFRVAETGAEALLGRRRADRVLRPLRRLGVLVVAVLVLAGLWFLGRDLWSVVLG